MPVPIPLHCNNYAGSGFLVADSKSIWLVTCVHIVSGTEKTPPNISVFKGVKLAIVGTNIEIPLYVGGQQRFSCVINYIDNFLVDAFAVKLSSSEAEMLNHYGAYDLDSITKAKVGDDLKATGFPGLQTNLIPATTIDATVIEINGLSIKLSLPSAPSFSGGPVVRGGGLIGLVHADVGKAPNFTNALVISFDVVGSQLFA